MRKLIMLAALLGLMGCGGVRDQATPWFACGYDYSVGERVYNVDHPDQEGTVTAIVPHTGPLGVLTNVTYYVRWDHNEP
jgi:hypothetical protein